jgi:hypothetical protein
MPDFQKILSVHRQLYTDSCAAAGMELILKLHEKKDPNWFDFQNEFEDENIGFKHLDRLSPYGIKAADGHLEKDDLVQLLITETQAGRFPLVSLPGFWTYNTYTGGKGPHGFHIWTAIPNGKSFQLVAGSSGTGRPDVVPDFDAMMQRINFHEPNYHIHHVRYAIA